LQWKPTVCEQTISIPRPLGRNFFDSKADANSKNQKDSIVKVFQKVFDEHLGYFGTVPAIAEFERRLEQRGQFEDFKGSFQESSGQKWEDCRDA
jgi:hypothetical protein